MELQGSLYCGNICTSKTGTDPPAPASAQAKSTLTPRSPHRYLKPRSGYQISFGEYKGKPNYLLKSKLGMDWDNLPEHLGSLCTRIRQASDEHNVLDFSLGTEGRFYFVHNTGREVNIETSRGLWQEIDEDFHSGGIRQLEFGAAGTFWGIKFYRKYDKPQSRLSRFLCQPSPPSSSELGYTVAEVPFGRIPGSLISKAQELYPHLKHYGQVDLIAVGNHGGWCMGVMGRLFFWEGLQANVVRMVMGAWKNGGKIMNIELSPIRSDIYFIEARDGSVAYHVPDEWHPRMRHHFQQQKHMLEHSRPDRQRDIPRWNSRPGPASPTTSPRTSRFTCSSENAAPREANTTFAPPPYKDQEKYDRDDEKPPQFDPPEYQPTTAPDARPLSSFANHIVTSGVVETAPDGGAENRRLIDAVVETDAAILNAGPQLVNASGNSGGCVVM
jgi:hypothetical protein